jgi:hypothetical protein
MRTLISQIRCVTILAVVVSTACAESNAAHRTRAIENELNGKAVYEFPTGKFRTSSGIFDISYLRTAETAGLVTVKEIPQAYWDSFLNTTQGLGTPLEVIPTDKLLGVALERIPAKGVFRVRASTVSIQKIVSEQKYTGVLASAPGEEYQLVLGTAAMTPTPAASVIGSAYASNGPVRFRCVAKQDAFTKEWAIIAIDLGLPDSDTWITATVK